MSDSSRAGAGLAAGAEALPAAPRPTRPLAWSLRRELWENRSIVLAPLVVAAFVVVGAVVHLALHLPERMRTLPADDPARLHALVVTPIGMPVAPVMLATFLVGIFFCADALYGERRDRSILFWKSLPVSDRTTVAAKALVPLAVLPAIGLMLGLVTFFALLLAGTAVLLANGISPATLWREVRFVQEPVVMLYGLTVHALWFAPIYGWVLLVSAWARRTPLLWAAVPPFALVAAEKVVVGTPFVALFLKWRVMGAMSAAFAAHSEHVVLDRLADLRPLRFLSSPGLWLGLIAAAACLAAAVRLRRTREPL